MTWQSLLAVSGKYRALDSVIVAGLALQEEGQIHEGRRLINDLKVRVKLAER